MGLVINFLAFKLLRLLTSQVKQTVHNDWSSCWDTCPHPPNVYAFGRKVNCIAGMLQGWYFSCLVLAHLGCNVAACVFSQKAWHKQKCMTQTEQHASG